MKSKFLVPLLLLLIAPLICGCMPTPEKLAEPDPPTRAWTATHVPTGTTVPPTATAQPTATPVPPTRTPDPRQNAPGDFYSTIMERDYRIFVSTPTGYDPDGDQLYPVVYLLDAQWYWKNFDTPFYRDGMGGLVGILSGQGLMPQVIVVGIDTGEQLVHRHANLVIDSQDFYKFITIELVPYIDMHYRADPEAGRTIIGHSDGCYFVLYALFQARKDEYTFRNFIGLSGDHGQHERENFIDEMRLWKVLGYGGSLDASLYLAWGKAEEERFFTSNKEMIEVLDRRDYRGFRIKSYAYDELTHSAVVFPGIRDGLIWVFGEGE